MVSTLIHIFVLYPNNLIIFSNKTTFSAFIHRAQSVQLGPHGRLIYLALLLAVRATPQNIEPVLTVKLERRVVKVMPALSQSVIPVPSVQFGLPGASGPSVVSHVANLKSFVVVSVTMDNQAMLAARVKLLRRKSALEQTENVQRGHLGHICHHAR